ncbi:hypothetical protein WSM22_17650 [Cytophagales bacterium WSM2-2]|nr:hypothetical protein WSM22_17650 [Cytophagales bacterium WSM2-2]
MIMQPSSEFYKDRTISELKKSNRRLKIALTVMIFIVSIMWIYAFVQQGIAKEMESIANLKAMEAQKNAEQANHQREMLKDCLKSNAKK